MKKASQGFEIVSEDPMTISGSFRHGMELLGKVETAFVIREPSTDDVLGAEADAHAYNTPLTYETALAARQLVSVGSFDGPFTLAMIRKKLSKPSDLQRLRAAQAELDRLLGEE